MMLHLDLIANFGIFCSVSPEATVPFIRLWLPRTLPLRIAVRPLQQLLDPGRRLDKDHRSSYCVDAIGEIPW